MTSAGIKRSNTFRNNNGTLYIFEHKNGTRVCCDALNQFARTVEVHASNLWHTFKCYNGRKWTGNWRIVKIFDLSRPDWKSISMWIKNCKMSKRITEKIHAVKRNLLSLIRSYRRTFINIFTENTEQACNASVVTTNSHLDELKKTLKITTTRRLTKRPV
jgi:hypothetical protein